MADKPVYYWGAVGSAVIFGLGFVSGLIYKRIFPVTKAGGGTVDTLARAARIAAIRAKFPSGIHKMVFVVRQDLGMGKGKIAAQCAHAAVMCYQKAMVMDLENLDHWEARGARKICLKAEGDDSTLKELQRKAMDMKLVTAIVRDAGHTQVDPGTITVLGIGPAPISEIDQITGHLKLM